MEADDISEMIKGLREEVVNNLTMEYIPPQSLEEQWDIGGLEQALLAEFNSTQAIRRWLDSDETLDEESLRRRIIDQIVAEYATKEAQWNQQGIDIRAVEKQVMLQILDQRWKEHLATMDHLRQGIHLRAYAQKQPKQEYKREAFELFQEMLYAIKREVIRVLSRIQYERPESLEETERRRREEQAKRMRFTHQDAGAVNGEGNEENSQPVVQKPETFVRHERKVGRNEVCPCGSGKKYKHCHGRAA
jgi:preprotein translocase subunit SecA